MAVEPITPHPPRTVRWSTFVQEWRELIFLHWAVEPETVAGLLPVGTRPDVLDGVTYVGLIPFRVDRAGLLAGPGIPYVGSFCETNVRLYSVDGAGRRGVVFRSLDAARLLPVLLGRFGVRLPYLWSKMRLHRDGDVITYTSRRRWPGPPGVISRVVARVGRPIMEQNRLERFLTARWGLHVSSYGRTWYLPNAHPPWELHEAELLDLDENLLGAAGLPAPTGAPVSVLYAPGVPVRFGPPVTLAGDPEPPEAGCW